MQTRNKKWLDFRFNLEEAAGAVGDYGTIFPIIIGVAVVSNLNLGYILLFFSLWYIITGLYYKKPVPVEPMKAMRVTSLLIIDLFPWKVDPDKLSKTINLIPYSVFGALMVFVGLEMGKHGLETDSYLITGVMAVLALFSNITIAFILGLGMNYILKKVKGPKKE
ncbi:MAG: putative sulfate/molybdate transporter [Candidatus Thermoplasmatota archaeon]|nr:putative sulfate/molybdate transporter [Candidatus Thermoplasmatota archaeon]